MYYVPEQSTDAEILGERLVARLQHANSAVVLTTIKVMIYLMNYMSNPEIMETLCKRISASLSQFLLSHHIPPPHLNPRFY